MSPEPVLARLQNRRVISRTANPSRMSGEKWKRNEWKWKNLCFMSEENISKCQLCDHCNDLQFRVSSSRLLRHIIIMILISQQAINLISWRFSVSLFFLGAGTLSRVMGEVMVRLSAVASRKWKMTNKSNDEAKSRIIFRLSEADSGDALWSARWQPTKWKSGVALVLLIASAAIRWWLERNESSSHWLF